MSQPMEKETARPRPFFSDRKLLLLVLALSAAVGAAYLALYTGIIGPDHGVRPAWFAPALMIACGEGFIQPQPKAVPGLEDFLEQRTLAYTPADLPTPVPMDPLTNFSQCHRYLLYTVAAVWRVFGISWGTLKIPLVILFCAAAAAVYGLFRLGMNRLFSLFGVLWFITSPLVLNTLPSIRDFSKAPFFLGALFLMGYLAVKGPLKTWPLLGCAALLGAVIGIGLGFRQDLLICIPPGILVLSVLLNEAGRLSVLRRAAAVAVMLLAFVACAWPILGTLHSEEGSEATHDIMMGLSTPCLETLHMRKPSYEYLYAFDDNYMHATRSSYEQRLSGHTTFVDFESPEASAAAGRFLGEITRTFPADLLTRAYAAVLYVLKDPAVDLGSRLRPDNPFQAKAFDLHAPLAAHFERFALFYASALLIGLSAWDPRLAWTVFLLFLYFSGYTSIQFQLRHCFHLSFVPLWILGALLSMLWYGIRQFASKQGCRKLWNTMRSPGRPVWYVLRRISVFGIFAFVLLMLPLAAARACQVYQVGRILEGCTAAELETIETRQEVSEDWLLNRPAKPFPPQDVRLRDLPPLFNAAKRLLPAACFRSPLLAQAVTRILDKFLPDLEVSRERDWRIRTEYLVAEFNATADSRPMGIRYQNGIDIGLDKIVEVKGSDNISGGGVKYFFPVYEFQLPVAFGDHWSRFEGIAVPIEQAEDFRALYRVKNIQDFHLLLNLSLPQDPKAFHYCYTLGLKPAPAPDWTMLRQQALLAKADAFTAGGAFDSALDAFAQAIRLQPYMLGAYAKLDALCAGHGLAKERVAAWQALAGQFPHVPYPQYYLGRALKDTGDLDGAVRAFRKAIDTDPGLAPAYMELGQVLFDQDAYEEATACFRQILAITPDAAHVGPPLVAALYAGGYHEEAKRELQHFERLGVHFPETLVEKVLAH